MAVAHSKGAELLITVDNGISSIEGVRAAKALGMTVVITDHHLPGNELPEADAIINPINRLQLCFQVDCRGRGGFLSDVGAAG